MFVRKRDPRYKTYLARQSQPPGAAPASSSGTATPKKTVPTSTFVAQDWQKVAEPSDAAADLEWARAEGAEDEEWECIACNKTFRSEAAWNSHERSKKHLRAMEQLKREMQNEELELELDLCQDDGEFADADVRRDHEKEEGDRGQGTAPDDGARPTVEGYTEKEPPEVTPDREASAPTPKEEQDATEGDQFTARPGRQKRAKPPGGATRRSSPQEECVDDLVFSEDNNLEALTLEEPRSHHEGNGGDIVREEDGAGTASSTTTKGELTKREKRRAREAAKKVRQGEAKSGCAVSFFFPHSNSIQFRIPPVCLSLSQVAYPLLLPVFFRVLAQPTLLVIFA